MNEEPQQLMWKSVSRPELLLLYDTTNASHRLD
jgi:hypothetical protein